MHPDKLRLIAYRAASTGWRLARVFTLAFIPALTLLPGNPLAKPAIIAGITAGVEALYRTVRPAYAAPLAKLVAGLTTAPVVGPLATAFADYTPPPVTVTPPAPPAWVPPSIPNDPAPPAVPAVEADLTPAPSAPAAS